MIVLDRFEGDYAHLETDDGMLRIRREQLSPIVKEGDVLIPGRAEGSYTTDLLATRERRRAMEALLRRVMR